ncbi:hypothetical protein [Streptomyces beihaiensis]|uniref:Uncharacterized protein n=1 Tax=Streptomyces beihaiensis TaxID=2984495 RepID=A0ABT3TT34_9ACTN|nr:hypothetical protein [Streptomyces beihaiensis]MCX3060203.1 hypothetical protein [Streptomyces beihaiensis]
MNDTAMNYLTVLFVFLLLAAPSLYGIAHDRRVDRQLREARAARGAAEQPPRRTDFTSAA